MTTTKAVLLGLTLVAAGVQAHAATELVSNGGFEAAATGTFSSGLTGWNVGVGNVDVVNATTWNAASGANSLDLNGTRKGEINQVLATVTGQTYTLSFDLAGNFYSGDAIKQLSVNVGANGLYTFNTSGASASAMGWTHYSTTFTAVGAATTLSFASNSRGAYGPALDNISVTAVTAVPEPESFAMLLAGLGMMGMIARRRKTTGTR